MLDDRDQGGERAARTEAVDLQLAIFDTVPRAEGLSVVEARELFADAVKSRDITPPSGLWVDAAMTSAALGRTYIISEEARRGAEEILRRQRSR